MKTLIRATTAYRRIAAEAKQGNTAHTTLVLFPDAQYLRLFLTECAKAFFCAEEGSRLAALIEKEAFSDCLFFPAPDGKLTVDDASRIVDESLLRPVEGEKKLFVLDGLESAAPLVQNKLLKALEEPTAGTYFLLGAVSEHALLPTVLSRAKKIAVEPFAEGDVEAALLRKYPGAPGAREAAAACGGIFSDAEELLAGGGEDFRLAERFLSEENVAGLCREIGEKRAKSFFSAVKLVLRDVLFLATGNAGHCARNTAALRELAGTYPAGALVSAIGFVSDAEREIKFNANPGQAALVLAVRIREERIKWQKLS